MYLRSDSQPLKTKIVATVGPDGQTLYDPRGIRKKNVSYDQLFGWFSPRNQPDSFMIDIFRLNMSFYDNESDRAGYTRVFDWVRKEKDGLARNVALLADLPGAKTRLGSIEKGEVEVEAEASFKL